MAIDRARHGQLICDPGIGDCYRACMSVLLGVPNGDHMPNDHSGGWAITWMNFLGQFGLTSLSSHYDGPIWKSHPWIASVVSKNFEGSGHAIVMNHTKIMFDPSPERRYHAGHSLLGQRDIVSGGTWLEVSDVTKFDRFIAWRREVNGKS